MVKRIRREADVVKVELAKGTYDVVVYKLGYRIPPRTVEVAVDASIRNGARA